MERQHGFLIFTDEDGMLCCISTFYIVSVYVNVENKIIIEDRGGSLHVVHSKDALAISKILEMLELC